MGVDWQPFVGAVKCLLPLDQEIKVVDQNWKRPNELLRLVGIVAMPFKERKYEYSTSRFCGCMRRERRQVSLFEESQRMLDCKTRAGERRNGDIKNWLLLAGQSPKENIGFYDVMDVPYRSTVYEYI
mmetsp:Transcript_16041/g.23702  ORF Transcript_16041/g.23702 Transcript_16041/m.23702 type:complete len:127 (+) Transcript_16041:701-1081(+)